MLDMDSSPQGPGRHQLGVLEEEALTSQTRGQGEGDKGVIKYGFGGREHNTCLAFFLNYEIIYYTY